VAGSDVAAPDSIVGIVPTLRQGLIAGHGRRYMLDLDSRTGRRIKRVAAVQRGRRIRTSVSRIDESTCEETSVNAKPNDPLRTFHEAAPNYGVNVTKADPTVSGVDMWQTSRIIEPSVKFCERGFQIQNSMHPASDCGAQIILVRQPQVTG
jgi:hypothetical protein